MDLTSDYHKKESVNKNNVRVKNHDLAIFIIQIKDIK